MNPPSASIRPYRTGDDDALMQVCLRTAVAGGDASGLVTDGELFGAIWCMPYLQVAPELASVVALEDDTPVGYVLGALDTNAFDAAADTRYWPAARERHPRGSVEPDTLDALLVDLIHSPVREKDADLLRQYPSHLHIDLLPEVQGQGWGRRLVDRLFAQLVERGSPGVHLGVGTANTGAIEFYRRLGFDDWSAENSAAETSSVGDTMTLTLVRDLRV